MADSPDADALLRLMQADQPDPDWSEADLRQMFHHQLTAHLQPQLEQHSPDMSRRVQQHLASGRLLPATLGDLLRLPGPSLELLQIVKDYAKSSRSHADPCVQKIATALYYSVCHIARVRCHERITRLSDSELAAGMQWIADQCWIDVDVRGVLQGYFRSL